MGNIKRAHMGEVLQPGPARTGASMKTKMLGEMEEQRSFNFKSSPVFYHLHFIPS